MIGEDPPHPDFAKLGVGDWVQLLTPTALKRGEVVEKRGISLSVLWQGHPTPAGVPDADMLFKCDPRSGYSMVKIGRQRRIQAPTGSRMSVKQAAALLGTNPKGVRRMLRAGELKGLRVDGRWVGVERSSVAATLRG